VLSLLSVAPQSLATTHVAGTTTTCQPADHRDLLRIVIIIIIKYIYIVQVRRRKRRKCGRVHSCMSNKSFQSVPERVHSDGRISQFSRQTVPGSRSLNGETENVLYKLTVTLLAYLPGARYPPCISVSLSVHPGALQVLH